MQRHLGQKIALAFAILFYAAGAACGLAAIFYTGDEPGDPIQASLMASVVFFVGAALVLQVIGTARLQGLLSGKAHKPYPDDEPRP